MWKHEIAQTEDGEEIELEQLSLGSFIHLEITKDSDGRYWPLATEEEGWIDIGTADTLDAAKKLAERWALDQIGEMFKALGAEGIWMLRGANAAELAYRTPTNEQELPYLVIEPPHERILLVRFPAGDGEPGGIEHF